MTEFSNILSFSFLLRKYVRMRYNYQLNLKEEIVSCLKFTFRFFTFISSEKVLIINFIDLSHEVIVRWHKFWSFLSGQLYLSGIFVEHSHDIFSEFSEKVSYEIPGNISKKRSGNIEYRTIPWMFHEYPTNVTCIFLGGSRNTIAVFSSG